MTQKIIILGTGGNCIDILEMLLDINDAQQREAYECPGFLDDNSARWGQQIAGVPVLGPLSMARNFADCLFVNGIGSPSTYWRKAPIIGSTGLSVERFATVIHPTAQIGRSATIGYGTVILPHVTVASNAHIGNHVVVLPSVVISHDAVIGDFGCIAGGACISGGVQIGASSYIGSNASLISNIRIGPCCLVGIGSVVLEDVAENSVVAGNPARFLRPAVETRAKQV